MPTRGWAGLVALQRLGDLRHGVQHGADVGAREARPELRVLHDGADVGRLRARAWSVPRVTKRAEAGELDV